MRQPYDYWQDQPGNSQGYNRIDRTGSEPLAPPWEGTHRLRVVRSQQRIESHPQQIASTHSLASQRVRHLDPTRGPALSPLKKCAIQNLALRKGTVPPRQKSNTSRFQLKKIKTGRIDGGFKGTIQPKQIGNKTDDMKAPSFGNHGHGLRYRWAPINRSYGRICRPERVKEIQAPSTQTPAKRQ